MSDVTKNTGRIGTYPVDEVPTRKLPYFGKYVIHLKRGTDTGMATRLGANAEGSFIYAEGEVIQSMAGIYCVHHGHRFHYGYAMLISIRSLPDEDLIWRNNDFRNMT